MLYLQEQSIVDNTIEQPRPRRPTLEFLQHVISRHSTSSAAASG